MSTPGFSAAEREAMKARAEELKAEKGGNKKAKEAQALLDAIATMPDEDRVVAERIHAIVHDVAPGLLPKTWYGMPAWTKDGAVLVFLQVRSKFGTRYCTLGFNDVAQLDDGPIWPSAYAVTEVTPAVDAQIRQLVTRAVG